MITVEYIEKPFCENVCKSYPFAIPRDSSGNKIDDLFYADLIPEGWVDLFIDMCKEIKQLNPPDDFYFTDVKEKHNQLRCYPSISIEDIDNIIQKYQLRSIYTCQLCGENKQTDQLYCDNCSEAIYTLNVWKN